MTDSVRERPACIECGAPARLTRALDAYDTTCSNECAIAAWNRDVERGAVVCVGEITTKKIDDALSTTGWDVPGEEELL